VRALIGLFRRLFARMDADVRPHSADPHERVFELRTRIHCGYY
jgi:hypothetical protein